jgi:hypothetical protein
MSINMANINPDSCCYTNPLDEEQGVKCKGEAIPVTDRGGPYGCKTSRLPHFADNRLTDGGKVVSLMRRPSFNPGRTWYSFPLEAESTPEP